MIRSEIVAREALALNSCRSVIDSLQSKLAERGLRCEEPQLQIWNPNPEQYCSEISAMIVKADQIVDVLEFFVFRDGQPIASPEEIERYTRGVLSGAAENG